MKKQISFSFLSLAFAMFSLSANAQNIDVAKVSYSQEAPQLQNNVSLNASPSVVSPEISSEAVSNFGNAFKGATEVKWSTIENGYFVTCISSGQKTDVVYNKNGKMNYSITTLDNSKIPQNLQQLIKAEYAAYTILKATEINNPGNVINQIILKSDKNFIIIKSNGDEIEVESIKNAS